MLVLVATSLVLELDVGVAPLLLELNATAALPLLLELVVVAGASSSIVVPPFFPLRLSLLQVRLCSFRSSFSRHVLSHHHDLFLRCCPCLHRLRSYATEPPRSSPSCFVPMFLSLSSSGPFL